MPVPQSKGNRDLQAFMEESRKLVAEVMRGSNDSLSITQGALSEFRTALREDRKTSDERLAFWIEKANSLAKDLQSERNKNLRRDAEIAAIEAEREKTRFFYAGIAGSLKTISGAIEAARPWIAMKAASKGLPPSSTSTETVAHAEGEKDLPRLLAELFDGLGSETQKKALGILRASIFKAIGTKAFVASALQALDGNEGLFDAARSDLGKDESGADRISILLFLIGRAAGLVE